MIEKRKPFYRRFTKKFFILTNVVLSIIFVFSCFGARLDPTTWWFMGLLNLAMPFILMVLILFFFFWILVRPRWSIITLITILACWSPILNIVPFNFAKPFQAQKQDGRLRVMTWNVEGFNIDKYKSKPQLHTEMLSLINEYKPDVACFQEVVGSDSAIAINSLSEFKEQLGFKEYYYSYNYKLDYDASHHFGISIFSRFPLLGKQTFSEYPHDYNSIFQYVDILYNQDTVRLFNVHLQSLKFDDKNREYIDNPSVKIDSSIVESKTIIKKFKFAFEKRGIQARHIHERILQSPYPVIVCGDFNDVPNSYAYYTIGKDLQNAFVEKGDGLGRTFMSISPTLRIDNIFASKAFKIEQFLRIRKQLSDHFPLIADMVLEKNDQ